MKVLAIAMQGKEFNYNGHSAHAVSDAGAEAIRDALNKARYRLKEGQVWHIYEYDWYTRAYTGAGYQSFTRRKGRIYEKRI